jgi:succinylarginine dihydrolase
MKAWEVNFDGIVGPTHNYAGLSRGNFASDNNRGLVASPKQAALQGLDKMKALSDIGLKQAVLPPHDRPHVSMLRRLGIPGQTDEAVLSRCLEVAPYLLQGVFSASNMWVANAATVSPFCDTHDGKTHITPANLSSMFHRSIESPQTAKILQSIFVGDDYVHHKPLPAGGHFSDEGAANHTRFCDDYHQSGVEFFVYGVEAFDKLSVKPSVFPARQTVEASQAIARLHQLDPKKTVFAQQNPKAIDAGVFHNDVIAVGNRNLLMYHEEAFLETDAVRENLNRAYLLNSMPSHSGIQFIEVPCEAVPITDAVNSYLFNSQLVTIPGENGTTIVAPLECKNTRSVSEYLQWLEDDHPDIDRVTYFDLKQSMRNGGGPACLRLRVVMSDQQIDTMAANVFLNDALYLDLQQWINHYYRDELSPDDLRDPNLLTESRTALDQLTQILGLGSIYEFQ